MLVPGNENHDISLQEASEWTSNYRTQNPGATKGFAFGKNAIADILAQPNCKGIRIYKAIDNNGKEQVIICGILENGDDIVTGKLAERSIICPPDCGTANVLNS
jgi:hypothetical protein